MLQNEPLVAKVGVDTAENEPIFGWIQLVQLSRFNSSILSLPGTLASLLAEATVSTRLVLDTRTRPRVLVEEVAPSSSKKRAILSRYFDFRSSFVLSATMFLSGEKSHEYPDFYKASMRKSNCLTVALSNDKKEEQT